MLMQLNPAINVITPLGKALAVMVDVTDFGAFWQTFQLETGESWWWDNHLIRFAESISGEHVDISQIWVSESVKRALAPHLKRYKHARIKEDESAKSAD